MSAVGYFGFCLRLFVFAFGIFCVNFEDFAVALGTPCLVNAEGASGGDLSY